MEAGRAEPERHQKACSRRRIVRKSRSLPKSGICHMVWGPALADPIREPAVRILRLMEPIITVELTLEEAQRLISALHELIDAEQRSQDRPMNDPDKAL